jgi:putative addiction module killer protein
MEARALGMEVIPQNVFTLILDDDSSPFDIWLDHIDDISAQGRISRQVDKLGRGLFGDHKDVGEGVSELRLDFGPGYRVYYGRRGNTVVVLLGGSTKKTQQAAMDEAKRLWRSYKDAGCPDAALAPWRGDDRPQEGGR